MNQVKIFNDNIHDYKEKYKDTEIHIKPGQYILMEADEATQFLGQMPPGGIVADHDGRPDKRYFKMLRREALNFKEDAALKTQTNINELNVCNRCKYVASGPGDLDEHVAANHMHELLEKDADEFIKTRPKK